MKSQTQNQIVPDDSWTCKHRIIIIYIYSSLGWYRTIWFRKLLKFWIFTRWQLAEPLGHLYISTHGHYAHLEIFQYERPCTGYGNQTNWSLTLHILYLGPIESPCGNIWLGCSNKYGFEGKSPHFNCVLIWAHISTFGTLRWRPLPMAAIAWYEQIQPIQHMEPFN